MFVPSELSKGAFELVAFSQTAIQLQQLIANQAKSPTALQADQRAMDALATTGLALGSQLETHRALQNAADAHGAESPNSAAAKTLTDVVRARGKLLREDADNTLKAAEQFANAANDPAAQAAVQVALQAAIDVNATINPKSARLKTLQKQQATVGHAPTEQTAAAEPFFAQFLENQNAGAGEPVPEPPGMMVTMKYPSDNEDGGSDGIGAVTEKYPSHAEDSEQDSVGEGGTNGAAVPGDPGGGWDFPAKHSVYPRSATV